MMPLCFTQNYTFHDYTESFKFNKAINRKVLKMLTI